MTAPKITPKITSSIPAELLDFFVNWRCLVYWFPLMHLQKTVAVLDGVLHIVGDPQAGETQFLYFAVRQLEEEWR